MKDDKSSVSYIPPKRIGSNDPSTVCKVLPAQSQEVVYMFGAETLQILNVPLVMLTQLYLHTARFLRRGSH